MHVCMPNGAHGDNERALDPQAGDWSDRWLWAAVWMPGIKSGSSARATNVLCFVFIFETGLLLYVALPFLELCSSGWVGAQSFQMVKGSSHPTL